MTITAELDRVVAEVGRLASERLPIVILDLDSTVIDTGPRHLHILTEYAAQAGDPALSAVVAGLRPTDFRFLVEEPLLARGFADPEALAALRAFWWERFLSDAYCRHDVAYPGAAPFAQRIVDAGGLVYYLTARPLDMAPGTLAVLQHQGFPCLRGRAVLHMKPSRDVDDHTYKRRALAEVAALRGVVCATFENEPAHAHALLEAFPDARHHLVGDIRSPTAPEPDARLVRLASFGRPRAA